MQEEVLTRAAAPTAKLLLLMLASATAADGEEDWVSDDLGAPSGSSADERGGSDWRRQTHRTHAMHPLAYGAMR
tara:strand:- start:258 stop:479 length:222 start_codon:yes stop_codon:yes gene_type:complete